MVGVTEVAIGDAHGLARRRDGTVVAWGEAYRTPAGLNDVIAIAAGSWHSLALRRDGTVIGWGESGGGQAEPPSGLLDVTAIAAGGHHSLALRRNGTVVAWGANTDGQTRVPFGLDGVVAIAAGAFHSLALRGDGTVAAWGHPDSDQRNVPYGLVGVVGIAAGYENSTAILADGSVVDWGVDRKFRRHPEGFHDVVQIAYGTNERLALRRDGTLVAHVGWVRSDQLERLGNVTSIVGSVTAHHSSFLALTAEGKVVVLKQSLIDEVAKDAAQDGRPPSTYPPTVGGSLHAAVSSEGIPFLAFVGPDDSFQFAAQSVAEARVVGGLVKALEVQIMNDDGSQFVVSFQGPIERMKAMLADCGIWMIF